MVMWQPTLRSPKIQLRPLQDDDFEQLFAAASDPLIWEQHPEPDRYRRDVFERFFRDGMKSGGALVVIDTRQNRIVGSSRFYDHHSKRVSIGFTFLLRACWGGVFNRELKTLMLDHAFLHVDIVQFEIGAYNFRSRRAVEKLGAVFIETQLADPKMGLQVDRLIYQLQRTAWIPQIDVNLDSLSLNCEISLNSHKL